MVSGSTGVGGLKLRRVYLKAKIRGRTLIANKSWTLAYCCESINWLDRERVRVNPQVGILNR